MKSKKWLRWIMVDILPNYDLPHIHSLMLGDTHRLQTYQNAIREFVSPGDVVIDYGTGTGILAMMAARAGARKVYAIDNGNNTPTTRKIIERNGLEEKIEIVNGDGFRLTLPERADIIVSEWMGVFVFQENMLPGLIKLRNNFLKETGKIIPSQISLYGAPSSQQPHLPNFSNIAGFDLSPYMDNVSSQPFLAEARPEYYLAKPTKFHELDILSQCEVPKFLKAHYAIAKDGIFSSFIGWFSANFYDFAMLDTSPATKTLWQQAQFILKTPIEVKNGQSLDVTIKLTQSRYDFRRLDFKVIANTS